MDKVWPSADDAVRDIPDGAVVAIAGFSNYRWPATLIRALDRHGARDLTLVCNSVGVGDKAPELLLRHGRISRLVAAFSVRGGRAGIVEEQIRSGRLAFELVPQGTLVERLRAAGAGIGAFYTRTGAGTRVAEGKEVRDIGGVPHVLEWALPVDFAFVRAAVADAWGNLAYRGSSRHFNPAFAQAARVTIAEAERIVPVGGLDPEAVGTPGIFVDRVVPATVFGTAEDDPGALDPTYRGRPRTASRLYDGRPGLTREQMAARVAALLPDGYVNLGVGLPTLVADFLGDRPVILHGENGILGYGPRRDPRQASFDVFDAGGQPVALRPGAAFCDSLAAHGMSRGGHLDAVVLGAYQVSEQGDLANWTTPAFAAGGVGGAMDLVAGGAPVIAMMEHCDRHGRPRILRACTFPLTGRRVVRRVVTDLAVIAVTRDGLVLEEVAPGFSPEDVQRHTAAPLAWDRPGVMTDQL